MAFRENGANLVLISTQTASASANINFTTGITSEYRSFLLTITNYRPATNAQALQMLWSINSGSSYIATNYQAGMAFLEYNTGTGTWGAINSTTSIPLLVTIDNSGSFSGGEFWLNDLTTGSTPKISGQGLSVSSGIPYHTICTGLNTANTNINAIRLQSASGNISTGTFKLYGVV